MPENILVDKKASRPGLLEVKISDFGHSKLVDDGYSTALTRVGTPQYWAPEVSDARACAKGYTEKVDLWSLGVVLYVMLEGKYPFDGVDMRIEHQVQQAHFTFKSQSSTSDQARDLIRSLIQVRPQDRLPLDKCLTHPWVMTKGGPLSQVMKVSNGNKSIEADEERFALRSDPKNVHQLRRDLQTFTTRFKFPAVLRKGEVAVSWERAHSTPQSKEEARKDLLGILAHHFPGCDFSASAIQTRTAGFGGYAAIDVTSRLATVKEENASKPRNPGSFRLLNVQLRVVDGTAGLDLQPERGGMKVRKVSSSPGQAGILEDDLIVKINEASLASPNVDEVTKVFGQHFKDGALLSIRRKSP